MTLAPRSARPGVPGSCSPYRRLCIFCTVVTLWVLGPSLAALPVPAITAIVNQVQAANTTADVDSYGDFLALLPVNAGDRRGYWDDRSPQPDLLAARTAIYDALGRLLGAGNVSYQRFTAGGYAGANIVGVLRGAGPAPIKHIVIGAHYDSVENPGADDDASGVAGLLEAARVLGRYRFRSTIVFVAFDQEEERTNGWGKGSQFYAAQAKARRDPIQAMAGLDMIAFNASGANRATISRCDTKSGTPGAQLSSRMATAFKDYSTLTTTQLRGEDASDPYRFYRAGYAALLVSEQFTSGGWPINPYYHELDDAWLDGAGRPVQYKGRPYVDLTYAAKVVRGVVGWAATEAVYLGPRQAGS